MKNKIIKTSMYMYKKIIMSLFILLSVICIKEDAWAAKGDLSLPVGVKTQIGLVGYDDVKWKSLNPSIVKVDKRGNVKALKVGKAAIVAKYDKNKKTKFYIYVFNPKKKLTGTFYKWGSVDFSIDTNWESSNETKIPVHYVTSNVDITQIDINIFNPREKGVFYIYIDKKYVRKVRVRYGTQISVDLSGKQLRAGIHTVEILQFEKDKTTNDIITYRKAKFRIKYE